jgi:hypothetical protein
MSHAFDVIAAAIEDLEVPAAQAELKRAIADVIEYWHDANHAEKDVINRKTPLHALERVEAAGKLAKTWALKES